MKKKKSEAHLPKIASLNLTDLSPIMGNEGKITMQQLIEQFGKELPEEYLIILKKTAKRLLSATPTKFK